MIPHVITTLSTVFPVLYLTPRDRYNWQFVFLNPFRLFCPSSVACSDGLFQGAPELSVRGPPRAWTFYTAHPFPFSCSPLSKRTDGLSAGPANGPIGKRAAHTWGFVGAAGPRGTALRNGQCRQNQQPRPPPRPDPGQVSTSLRALVFPSVKWESSEARAEGPRDPGILRPWPRRFCDRQSLNGRAACPARPASRWSRPCFGLSPGAGAQLGAGLRAGHPECVCGGRWSRTGAALCGAG